MMRDKVLDLAPQSGRIPNFCRNLSARNVARRDS